MTLSAVDVTEVQPGGHGGTAGGHAQWREGTGWMSGGGAGGDQKKNQDHGLKEYETRKIPE